MAWFLFVYTTEQNALLNETYKNGYTLKFPTNSKPGVLQSNQSDGREIPYMLHKLGLGLG